MKLLFKLLFATAIVALTLPVLSLADVSGTATLTATTGALNLDAGTTGTTGDLLWNGTTLTPQGSAKAAVLPVGGSPTAPDIYNSLNAVLLSQLVSQFPPSSAPISSSALTMNAILAVQTNGGNTAKLLVISNSGSSLGLQYTTFGATGGGGGGGGNGPTISDVQNAASNVPSGLPNGAIAQGALFVVKGSNLGPATFIAQTAFPFTTSIGGTSIQVTVGGATVDVIMFYSLAGQVAGILPSKTNIGTGTLKLTYNGQSATSPITVVNRNVGIYTVSMSGSGDAIAFVNSDAQLITPTHAANADDVIVLWGTGLGPVNLDETMAVGANQADLGDIGLHVYIGGTEANVIFKGRNGCCTSVDTVYVTVPHGVTGCAVSVLMQIGNIVSNATSIAIANSGRTCTPTNQNSPIGATGTYSYGSLYLGRLVEATSKSDVAGGQFSKVTFSSPPTGSQLDINAPGSCSVTDTGQVPPPSVGTTPLDAGPSIGVAGPNGLSKTLTKSSIAGSIFYGAQFDQTATTLTAGSYTFTGPGGPDVPAFTANYTMPPVFAWTNQSNITTVARANGVTVNWSGGNPSGFVYIMGSSSTNTIPAATASFTCTARVSDLMFAVPSAVLLALPPSGSGTLTVSAYDYQPFTPPSGINFASVGSNFTYGSSVTYQ
jgi:uncharacterized protein (TIGR03437 family)